jgi:hypothetical protein
MKEIESFLQFEVYNVDEFRFYANEISFGYNGKCRFEYWRRFFLVLDLICIRLIRFNPEYFWYQSERALFRRVGRRLSREPKIRRAAWRFVRMPLSKDPDRRNCVV